MTAKTETKGRDTLSVFWGYGKGRLIWVQCGRINITPDGAFVRLFASPVDPYWTGLLNVRHPDWKSRKAAGEYDESLPDRRFKLMYGFEDDGGIAWVHCGTLTFRGSGDHYLNLHLQPVGPAWNGQFVLREIIPGQKECPPATLDSMYPNQGGREEV